MGSIDPQTRTWQEIAAQKRALRDQALKPYLPGPEELDIRPPRVDNVAQRFVIVSDPKIQKITDIDSIPVLQRCLSEGEFTAEEVVSAYIKR
jgi:amidase